MKKANTATAGGTIIHHGLKDWNYDVSLEHGPLSRA